MNFGWADNGSFLSYLGKGKTNTVTKELEQVIFKSLLKEELTFKEKQELNNWLDSDKAHQKTLSHMKLIMTRDYESTKSQIKAETWEWLMESNGANNKQRSFITDHSFSLFLKIAVVLLLMSTIGILSYQSSTPKDQVVYTDHVIEKVALPGQKITTILPDGTRVKLNSGSQLIVPDQFTGDKRQVKLTGEAFFEVAHDKSKPFIIKTQQMDISVLGTSFNVRSYLTDDLIEVSVATGKVAFSREMREGQENQLNTYLTQGEKGSYSKSKNLITKQEFNPSVEYGWKDNLLVFDQDRLTDILSVLSNWYGTAFKFEDEYSIPSRTFSGSYEDPSLSTVVQGLSYVYRFEYELKKDSVIIKKGK